MTELTDEQIFGVASAPQEMSDADVFGAPPPRAVQPPEQIPQAMEDRLNAGHEARQREGGLLQTIPQGLELIATPEGRTRLWEAVKKYPSKFIDDTINMAKLPGDVESGKIDLNTEDGMDQAIGLGMLIGGSRLNKLGVTGKTSGLSVAMGESVSRIDRGPMGEIVETPIGRVPRSEDFANAANIVGGDDVPFAVQEKLLRAYQERGLHPAELGHDAQTDPIVAQRLLSSDPVDLPGSKSPEPPKPPTAPPESPLPPPDGSFEASQQKILDKISVGESAPQEKWTWSKFYTKAIDDLHPLKGVDEDAYTLARLTRGQFGKAEHFLEHGTFDFDTYETNGKPLAEVLAPVRDDLDGIRAYLASKRALEIEASGRKSGMDLDAAREVVDDGAGKYEKIAGQVGDYQENVLRYLKQSGVLSDAAFDAMREAGHDYVPFYRVMGSTGQHGGAGKGFGPGNPLKRLKGSERDVIDPLESIIKNTYAFVSVAERNAVGIKLIDALKAKGAEITISEARDPELAAHLKEGGVSAPEKLVDFVKSALPEDGTTLSAFRDGVKETVKVSDPEIVKAYRGLDQGSADMLTRFLAGPAKSLRAGAVLSPDFIARNLVSDFFSAFVNTAGSIFSPIDTFKGALGVIRKDADFTNWLKSGGANATMVGLDRRYMQESLAKLTAETGLGTRAWNVVTSPLSGLRLLSELAENATRLGEFKKLVGPDATKEQIQAAGYSSREVTLDFARVGASMRAYNMITAFANAQIQGLDRIGRAFKDKPAETALKVAGSITLPSVLLWFANHDDPRYKELPSWQKDLFFIIMTKDHIFRLPKLHELGVVFGSGVERILDATIGGNSEAFDGFAKSVMQIMTPNFIPTAVLPVVEQFANRSTFSDRTLIPADMEKYLPEYQYTPYTTETTKALGKIISAFPGMRDQATGPGAPFGPIAKTLTSPILMENYIRSWTGGLGIYALQAADASLRKAGVLPDPVLPAATLADIPFVKAFVVRYPSASAQSIQDFYDQQETSKKFYDTWSAKAKEGDVEAMSHIQAAGGSMMFMRLDALKQTLTEHSKLVRDIYKNPNIKPDEKRQLIDSLYFNMIEIGRGGMQMVREGKKALTSP